MRFTLEGEIIFSKNVEKALKDIEDFIKQSNQELFLKGVPEDQEEDASKIIEWNLEENALKLKIISGRRGRAHDALLRMKNPLTNLLGQKYHIGVRKIHVDTYEIMLQLPREPELDASTGLIKVGEVDLWATLIDRIIDMPYVSHSEIIENKLVIKFENLNESELRKHVVDRVLKFIKESLESSSADHKGDATEEAVRLGWVKKFPGKGQWFYGPQLIALQRAIEDIFLEKLVYQLDFMECMWPKLIPIPVMNKMRYLEGLPEGMYYCSAPKRDPELFEKFKQELLKIA